VFWRSSGGPLSLDVALDRSDRAEVLLRDLDVLDRDTLSRLDLADDLDQAELVDDSEREEIVLVVQGDSRVEVEEVLLDVVAHIGAHTISFAHATSCDARWVRSILILGIRSSG
jgi:hypothetical protein